MAINSKTLNLGTLVAKIEHGTVTLALEHSGDELAVGSGETIEEAFGHLIADYERYGSLELY